MARSVSDPYALNPPDKKTGPDKRDEKTYKYHSQLETWVAPFIMAGSILVLLDEVMHYLNICMEIIFHTRSSLIAEKIQR